MYCLGLKWFALSIRVECEGVTAHLNMKVWIWQSRGALWETGTQYVESLL